MAYNSILQFVIMGKSRQELEVASHIHSQEQSENGYIVSTAQLVFSILYIQDHIHTPREWCCSLLGCDFPHQLTQ